SWQTWDPGGSFVSDYIAESEAHHMVPVFSYYQIRQSLPGAGIADETTADLGNLDNQATNARLLPRSGGVLRQGAVAAMKAQDETNRAKRELAWDFHKPSEPNPY